MKALLTHVMASDLDVASVRYTQSALLARHNRSSPPPFDPPLALAPHTQMLTAPLADIIVSGGFVLRVLCQDGVGGDYGVTPESPLINQ